MRHRRHPPESVPLWLRVSVRSNHCLRGNPILNGRQIFTQSHRDAERHEKEKCAIGATHRSPSLCGSVSP